MFAVRECVLGETLYVQSSALRNHLNLHMRDSYSQFEDQFQITSGSTKSYISF